MPNPYPQRLASLLELTVRALEGERTDSRSLEDLQAGLTQLLDESSAVLPGASPLHPGRVAQACLSTALPFLTAHTALREGLERARHLHVELPLPPALMAQGASQLAVHLLRTAHEYAEIWSRRLAQQEGRAA